MQSKNTSIELYKIILNTYLPYFRSIFTLHQRTCVAPIRSALNHIARSPFGKITLVLLGEAARCGFNALINARAVPCGFNTSRNKTKFQSSACCPNSGQSLRFNDRLSADSERADYQ